MVRTPALRRSPREKGSQAFRTATQRLILPGPRVLTTTRSTSRGWGEADGRRQTNGNDYRSKQVWGQLPVVHIAVGVRQADGRYRLGRARGIIALGDIAIGLVAVGGVAIGPLSVGRVALGLVAVGAVAVGLAAVGAVSIGLLAVGAVAIGLTSVGVATAGLVAAHGRRLTGGSAALAASRTEARSRPERTIRNSRATGTSE